MALGSSPDHEHPSGFPCLPWKLTPATITQATGYSRTMDLDMTFSSSTARHHHGFRSSTGLDVKLFLTTLLAPAQPLFIAD